MYTPLFNTPDQNSYTANLMCATTHKNIKPTFYVVFSKNTTQRLGNKQVINIHTIYVFNTYLTVFRDHWILAFVTEYVRYIQLCTFEQTRNTRIMAMVDLEKDKLKASSSLIRFIPVQRYIHFTAAHITGGGFGPQITNTSLSFPSQDPLLTLGIYTALPDF